MNKIYIYFLTILIISTNIHAEDLTDIQISAPVLNSQDLTNQAIENINTKNAIDGGDLLRSINGISTIRRGGHGLDPVIRGQSDQRLNSSIDGAIVYGACSSKMDPASTYVNIENYDSISVIKGSQSVIYGAGGPGDLRRRSPVRLLHRPDVRHYRGHLFVHLCRRADHPALGRQARRPGRGGQAG